MSGWQRKSLNNVLLAARNRPEYHRVLGCAARSPRDSAARLPVRWGDLADSASVLAEAAEEFPNCRDGLAA